MASTIAPQGLSATQRAEYARKVSHPLERLRGAIRTYVSLEGAAVLVIYLALWFWIGLLLDYGIFKSPLRVDWVQELPFGLRAGILVILVAGLLAMVVTKVLLRLMRDFRSSSLALVLERRFPKLLGDRLITAVELADTRIAPAYGYSQQMIDQTIQEAAERVDQIPINEAFNWDRLKRYGIWGLALTIGLYLLTGVGYCLVKQKAAVGDFVTSFNNVAVIWFERNVLLANTIWPRQAYLEVVDVRSKVGRNVASTPIRVRAIKWTIADRDEQKAPEGWRACTLKDVLAILKDHDPQLGETLKQYAEKTQRDPQAAKLDELELSLDRERSKLPADTIIAMRSAFEKLDGIGRLPSLGRTFRVLGIPDTVTVYYKGDTIRSEMTIKKEANNEYPGTFTDLKENIRFRVCALDYCTQPYQIEVVPPPSLSQLTRREWQPAYLYHRPPLDGKATDLKGLKQEFPPENVYTSSETARIDVPAGTDIELTGLISDKKDAYGVYLEKALRSVKMVARGKEGAALPPVNLEKSGRKFTTRFENVTGRIDFEFEFTNTDDVSGRRHIIIQAMEDVAPEVDVVIEVLRKTGQGYLATPVAMIPMSGKVRDDRGLAKLDFAYTYTKLENQAAAQVRSMDVAMGYHLGPTLNLSAGPYLAWIAGRVGTVAEEQPQEAIALPTFERKLQGLVRGDVNLDRLRQQLIGRPPQRGLLREHVLVADDYTRIEDQDYLDLRKYLPQLQVGADSLAPPRYRMRLWVAATDNNVETGPKVGESKERFTILVVSEIELLAEIAKEEETLHLKIEQLLEKLRDTRLKLDDEVIRKLQDPKFEEKFFSPLATRTQEFVDTITSGAVTAKEVHDNYARILRELRYNRVRPEMIKKVENIVKLLDLAVRNEFVQAEESQHRFQQALEGNPKDKVPPRFDKELATDAQRRLIELIVQLERVMTAMGEITNLNKLIVTLQTLEQDQRTNVALLIELRRRIEEEAFKDFLKKP